jgi:hypothetical protein
MSKYIISLLLTSCAFFAAVIPLSAQSAPLEEIIYDVEPLGVSVYQDMGRVDFRGGKLDLVIFKTQVAAFKDTEKIYSDTETYLPLWVERDLEIFFHKEYLTEDYVPQENRLLITKFEGGKKVREYPFKADGPIHNAVLLPFSLRKVPDLKVGWAFKIRLPDEFMVKLVAVEEVSVPAGKFRTFHFISDPHKFEIWITTDALRLPVKITGCGGLPYTMKMKKRIAAGR